jgi:hypothetical protein
LPNSDIEADVIGRRARRVIRIRPDVGLVLVCAVALVLSTACHARAFNDVIIELKSGSEVVATVRLGEQTPSSVYATVDVKTAEATDRVQIMTGPCGKDGEIRGEFTPTAGHAEGPLSGSLQSYSGAGVRLMAGQNIVACSTIP